MAVGSTNAQMVSSSFSSLTTRYRGTMPPEKNMVNVTSMVKNFLPEKLFRVSG